MQCPHCHVHISSNSKHCKRCGGAIPSSQYLLEECGLAESAPANRPSPTSAAAPAPGRPLQNYRFARLGDRFIAFVLDIAVLFGLFAVVDAWAFMRWGVFEATELQLTTASLLIAVSLNAAILFFYGCLLEAACGATLGKVLVGIRVVRTSKRGPLASCAMRNLVRIVDGLFFYLVGTTVAACSSTRQRIGDLWAHTAVIEEGFGVIARASAIVLWLAILTGAGWAVPRICSESNPAHAPYLNQVIIRVGTSGKSAYLRVGGFSLDFHS